ncbi:PH domain-containing protein [Nocardioides dongkuii]|uniref:PH domain-containing protein n=1 Tax=Nocardioides dongkuii TaxID=2760089 RepID=UPI0015FD2C41|nr:PH domain-containing protein [Nocardioides dongkuii]
MSDPARPAEPPDHAVVLPHTWRPIGPRIAGAVAGVLLLVLFLAAWLAMSDVTRAKFTGFQIGTLVVFWLLGAFAMNALVRSRVVAERERLVIVNGYRRRELEWPQVVAVRLPPGAPWVTLDLADGQTISAMGIQGSDGARAQRAVRELRALVDQPPNS